MIFVRSFFLFTDIVENLLYLQDGGIVGGLLFFYILLDHFEFFEIEIPFFHELEIILLELVAILFNFGVKSFDFFKLLSKVDILGHFPGLFDDVIDLFPFNIFVHLLIINNRK